MLEMAGAAKMDEARWVMETTLEFNPGSGQSMVGLGQVYEQAGATAMAIRWYEKSLEIFPENRQVLRRFQQLTGGGK